MRTTNQNASLLLLPQGWRKKKDAFFENFSLCLRRYVDYPVYYPEITNIILPYLCAEYCTVISISKILRQKS